MKKYLFYFLFFINGCLCIFNSALGQTGTIFGQETVYVGMVRDYNVSFGSQSPPCTVSQYVWSACNSGSAVGAYQGVNPINIRWLSPGSSCAVTVSCNGIVRATKNIIVLAATLNAGFLQPKNITIAQGAAFQRISGSEVYGGVNPISYDYQWQSSTDGTNFSNVSSSSNDYIDVSPSVSTYYRRRVIQGGTTAYSDVTYVSVYNALANNSITYLNTDSIAWGSTVSITGSLPTGGDCNNNYSYRWEYSNDGVSFIAMTNENGFNSHFASLLHSTTWYRRVVYCGRDYSTSNSVVAKVKQILFHPSTISSHQTIAEGATPTALSGSAATGGTSGTYSYQWQYSIDEVNWQNQSGATSLNYAPGALNRTTYYRRKAINSIEAAFSNSIKVKVIKGLGSTIIPNTQIQSSSEAGIIPVAIPSYRPTTVTDNNLNYIRVWDINKPAVTTLSAAKALTNTADFKQVTEYFDGYGRSSQTVSKKMNPDQQDVIAFSFYDDLGRSAQKFLPYIDNGNSGSFRLNVSTQQPSFYNSHFNNLENFYYSNTVFEASPENRVLKQTEPGNAWTGSNFGVRSDYSFNSSTDSVRVWTIGNLETDIPQSTTIYGDNNLLIEIITDEHENKVLTYKDREGNVILKKVQLWDNPATGHSGWLNTYYVYDVFNQLRYVIPPKAIENAMVSSWSLNSIVRDELCYKYLYDQEKRMIIKKIPGAADVYMVYDKRDRLVYSQDGNMRLNNNWLINLYDGLNRVTSTGIITYSSGRAALQTFVDQNTGTGSVVQQNVTLAQVNELYINNRETGRADYKARNSIVFSEGFTTETSAEFETLIDPSFEVPEYVLVSDNPLPTGHNLKILTTVYYNDYNWTTIGYNSSNHSKLDAGVNVHAAALPSQPSVLTRGMITGMKIKILEDPANLSKGELLFTVNYYDDKSRIIQVSQQNHKSGFDVTTNRYDFTGRIISSYLSHNNPAAGSIGKVFVKTNWEYDATGRPIKTWKTINDEPSKVALLSENDYNSLGQLHQKLIGRKKDASGNYTSTPLETQDFVYNIRGWLRGLNSGFVSSTAVNNRFFGFDMAYDFGFTAKQLNGNITGVKWRSKGDGEQRAYGYDYDNLNRLKKADFTQNNSGWNISAGLDFSVSNLSYDAMGNILRMTKKGVKVNSATIIDDLTYSYSPNSNKLLRVTDAANDSQTKLGDFKDGLNTADDYGYDVNGNLVTDLNKNLTGTTGLNSTGSVSYNHLNLPNLLTIGGKGTIQYLYDAAGRKLNKEVTEGIVISNTEYINGFVYRNDSLQFFGHEEGRVRYSLHRNQSGTTAWQFDHDYFLNDHLGNVRMVLTEQQDTTNYLASMEETYSGIENALFSNINSSRSPKPAGYPTDNTTDPNNFVAKLNANSAINKKTGPSIVLKVMAGDQLDVGTKAFYDPNTLTYTPVSPLADILNILANNIELLSSGVKGMATQLNQPGSPLSQPINNFLSSQPNGNTTKPKAFLNWLLVDEQFKKVDNASGYLMVGSAGVLLTLAQSAILIPKNGYFMVWVSNETPDWNVYFDNVTIKHYTGPLLEETHFYPFGLVMSGISSKALNGVTENKKKFNGIEHTTEFDLNTYDAFFRNADPQIGRWWQIDPKPNEMQSLYSMMGNNPIRFADPLGDTLRFTSAQIQNQSTVNNVTADLQRATGLTLSIDANGNLAYATTTNSKGKQEAVISKDANGKNTGSKSARKDLMKAINSSKTVDVFAQNNIGSKGGGLQVNIDAVQVNKFIAGTSSDLNNFTQGFGMTFLHELQHTDIFGGKSDPAKQTVNGQVGVPFGDIGGPETRINKVRRELNQQGMNLGQRLSYGPMPMGTTGMVYLPFSNRSLNDINSGTIPTSMMISYIP